MKYKLKINIHRRFSLISPYRHAKCPKFVNGKQGFVQNFVTIYNNSAFSLLDRRHLKVYNKIVKVSLLIIFNYLIFIFKEQTLYGRFGGKNEKTNR